MVFSQRKKIQKTLFSLKSSSVGTVAQLVEQWPFKPTVVGSIPTGPTRTKLSGLIEVSKWDALRASH